MYLAAGVGWGVGGGAIEDAAMRIVVTRQADRVVIRPPDVPKHQDR
jgi:hypothetical protein